MKNEAGGVVKSRSQRGQIGKAIALRLYPQQMEATVGFLSTRMALENETNKAKNGSRWANGR